MKRVLIFLLGLLLLSACTQVQAPTPVPQQENTPAPEPIKIFEPDFTNANFERVLANPDQYKGSAVEISGKIFINPRKVGDKFTFQLYQGGKDDLNKNVIVYVAAAASEVRVGNCVGIKGTVQGQEQGVNSFGATVSAVAVDADQVEIKDCVGVTYPTIRSIDVQRSLEKSNVLVTLERVELAYDHTRVYLKIKNNAQAKVSFAASNVIAVQDKRQFKQKSIVDVDYPTIESTIYPGVEEEGVITLEPMNPDVAAPINLILKVNSAAFDEEQFDFSVR